MVRAVLDANVYVSAAVRVEGPPGQIVERFLRNATFELVVSQAIAAEVLRAFTYPKVRKYIRAGLDPELWFEDIVVLAQWVSGEYELAGVCKDPDDDKYHRRRRRGPRGIRRGRRFGSARRQGIRGHSRHQPSRVSESARQPVIHLWGTGIWSSG